MTDVLVGVCDLCGGDHPAGSCLQTSQLGIQGKAGGQHEAHLAYQSLPSWVEVQEGPGELQAVLRQQVPRMTRIGPLVAPHTPRLPQNTIFPLKICHEGGGQTFLDLSRKWLCNWLSLIPVGTPARHNLVACQIDDLIYYVSVENIPAGSGLLVWYAPFYQPKVQKELQEVGSPYSLLGAMVVTQKVSSGVQPSAKKPLVLAPTLARIVVGQGMVTFTHYNVQQGDADGFFTHQLLYLEDKYGTGILPPRCTQLPESPSALMIQGITHIKKYLLEGNTSELYNGQPSQVNIRPSIQLASVNEDLAGLECMVRLTVTAAEESGDDGDNEEELLGEDTAEEFYSDTNSAAEGTRIAHSSPISHQKRKYRHQNERKSVSVAGSDRVKQLPPRALGARDSRSWTCCYCSQTHSCLLTFTRHLKAHLLWLVGRCYVCQKCGLSLSSTELLQRHQQSAHLHNANSLPHTAEDEGATKSRKRKIWKSTASSDEEEGVDHSNKKDSYNSLKRIAALPTKPIEGPHTCQICTRIFDKPQYLLRHLRKHSGDFTCQSCLKVMEQPAWER